MQGREGKGNKRKYEKAEVSVEKYVEKCMKIRMRCRKYTGRRREVIITWSVLRQLYSKTSSTQSVI
jgi:hypothetical protein